MRLEYILKTKDLIDIASGATGQLFITRFNTAFLVRTKQTETGTVFYARAKLEGIHALRAWDALKKKNYEITIWKRG